MNIYDLIEENVNYKISESCQMSIYEYTINLQKELAHCSCVLFQWDKSTSLRRMMIHMVLKSQHTNQFALV